MKFLADEMCGNLSRWLRMLGYDTTYAKDYETAEENPLKDNTIIDICFNQQRILISRDREMIEIMANRFLKLADVKKEIYLDFGIPRYGDKLNSPSLLLKSQKIIENLQQIQGKFNITLKYDINRTRCPLCNSLISRIENKETVKDLIPEKVFVYHDKFWKCNNPSCGKIYWMGTHFKDILETLEKAKNLKTTS
jgi:hypothetical protein